MKSPETIQTADGRSHDTRKNLRGRALQQEVTADSC